MNRVKKFILLPAILALFALFAAPCLDKSYFTVSSCASGCDSEFAGCFWTVILDGRTPAGEFTEPETGAGLIFCFLNHDECRQSCNYSAY